LGYVPLRENAAVEMGTSPPGSTCNFEGRGDPLLNGPTEFGADHPAPVQWTTSASKFAQEGDLLICVRGATAGRTNWADQRYGIGRGLAAVRGRPGKGATRFLYHMLRDRRDAMASEARGSTFMNMGQHILLELPVPNLDLSLQHTLAGLLSDVERGGVRPPEWRPRLASTHFADLPRVAAKVEALAAANGEALRLRRQAMAEADALLGSAITAVACGLRLNGALGDYLLGKPRNGWSARCDGLDGGTPVLSLGAVTGFRYRPNEFKRTSEPTYPDAHYWLGPGDLLITRSNTPELVGHAAIYDGRPGPCIYPDLMMRLVVDKTRADKWFVYYLLRSLPVREYIRRHAKGTSPTMKKISQGVVMGIPFPADLSRDDQARIVKRLDYLEAQVDNVKRLQSETATELDSLLPAVLAEAFAGRL
jgi:restriction endonuclease S subunit